MRSREFDIVGPIIKWPRTVLAIYLVFSIFLGMQAASLEFSSDMMQYLPEGFESVEVLNEIFETWPTERVSILVEADNVTHLKTIREMDRIVSLIDTIPDDDGSGDGVVSTMGLSYFIKIVNEQARLDEAAADSGTLPSDQSTVDQYLTFLPADQLYQFITPDHKYAIISLTINTDDYDPELLMQAIDDALAQASPAVITSIAATGDLYIETAISDLSFEYLQSLLPLAVLVVVLFLFVIFRSIKKVITALLPPSLAAMQTFGFLVLSGQEANITLISVGPLIIGFGVAYSIYVINRFGEERMNCADAETAVKNGGNKMATAIFLSSITTIVGFLALATSDMPTTVIMGIANSLGIALCFIAATVVIPCMLLLLNVDSQVNLNYEQRRQRTKNRIARVATVKPETTLIVAALVSILAISNIPNVQSEFNYSDMMPEGIQAFEDSQKISEVFESGDSLFIIFEGDIRDPNVLMTMDEFQQDLLDLGYVSYTTSIVDSMRISDPELDLRDIINYILGRPLDITFSEGRLPETREEATEILDGLDDRQKSMMTTPDYSKSLMIISMPIETSSTQNRERVGAIRDVVDEYSTNQYVTFSAVSGILVLGIDINDLIMDSQATTTMFSILFVFLAILLIFRSPKFGLITLIPMLAVIIWNLGMMPILGVSLNIATVMMTSILMGTGVDFGIQITQRLRQELGRGIDPRAAVRIAVQNQGGSMIETCATTIAGFSVVMLMPIPAIQGFILLMALGLAFSCLAAVFVLPAVYLKLIDWGFIKSNPVKAEDEDAQTPGMM